MTSATLRVSRKFAEACARRGTEHAAQTLERAGHRAEAARLIGSVGLDDALAMFDGPQGYAVERWWQSEWLVGRLELEPV
jgi:hypothetical protein